MCNLSGRLSGNRNTSVFCRNKLPDKKISHLIADAERHFELCKKNAESHSLSRPFDKLLNKLILTRKILIRVIWHTTYPQETPREITPQSTIYCVLNST